MPRYMVEATRGTVVPFPPVDLMAAVERNAMADVTWICTFIGELHSFGLYEGPHPEAVRRAAAANGLVVERINEVRLFDPHAYRCADASHD